MEILIIHEAYRQSEFEEIIGELYSTETTEIGIIAIIGNIKKVWLPDELDTQLKGLIGQRIGILRLEGYHVRCLGEGNRA